MRYFGTDGVRGIANRELTAEMAFELGRAAVRLLGPQLVVGRDTRLSGTMLATALAAGITASGGTCRLAGIVPTPAVALLTRQMQADGGVVISASHNPPEYNGIKFFDRDGFKLTRDVEDAFETVLQDFAQAQATLHTGSEIAGGAGTGVAEDVESNVIEERLDERLDEQLTNSKVNESYILHGVDIVRNQGFDLSGLTIAVDAAYGAASYTTPETLRQLGARVVTVNAEFDGARINVDCGSTNLTQLKALVLESKADIGIAHDGDADRVIAVDAKAATVDGDVIEAICALDLQEQGRLSKDTVVTTVMANMGFVKAMEKHGITVVQTAVGDANVLAAMREGGFVIGGEQSGHMILLEHNSTGDGLVTALQLAVAMKRSGKTLEQLGSVMQHYPQVTINVKVVRKEQLGSCESIATAERMAQDRLGDKGRVLLRASGTEPLVRVMVEAETQEQADQEASKLAEIVSQELT